MTNKQNTKFIAHVRFDENEQPIEHWLEDHLRKVANLSAKHASVFGSEDWAELAGRWHDLGKYSLGFQGYIKKVTGYDTEAHIETIPGKVDHSTAGASYAIDKLGHAGRVIAYLIARSSCRTS